MNTAIDIRSVSKHFILREGGLSRSKLDVRAVDDVSLTLSQGEIVGLVGESGSGKTTLARLILGLARPTGGQILMEGQDIAALSRRRLKALRRQVAVVFQDPASNLNPRQTVEQSIMRPMLIHGVLRAEAKARARAAMEKVKMDPRYLDSHPHQLSGGQLQRIAVARALVLEPRVMILDEPTSALDISIQAQVLNLLLELQRELGLTYLVISHDLNVIRYISDRVAVMYLGQLVEEGKSRDVFENPAHPYTKGLMAAAPVTHPSLRGTKSLTLEGDPGSLIGLTGGCPLAPRCPYAQAGCREERPPLTEVSSGHRAACFMINRPGTWPGEGREI